MSMEWMVPFHHNFYLFIVDQSICWHPTWLANGTAARPMSRTVDQQLAEDLLALVALAERDGVMERRALAAVPRVDLLANRDEVLHSLHVTVPRRVVQGLDLGGGSRLGGRRLPVPWVPRSRRWKVHRAKSTGRIYMGACVFCYFMPSVGGFLRELLKSPHR